MQNTKILEMLNAGQIEELKALIQDEIFTDGLKSNPGAKQRYSAMKKYFTYTKDDNNGNNALHMPCVIDFDGEKYTSFVNGFSLALTKEDSGEMEQFDNPDNYLNVGKLMVYEGTEKEIDFTKVIAEAKSKGYKLKKSEVERGNDWKYVFCYDGVFYKIGLLDVTYGIINNGEKPTVYHKDGEKYSPLIIKNSIGYCLLLPVNTDEEELRTDKNKVVIDVA